MSTPGDLYVGVGGTDTTKEGTKGRGGKHYGRLKKILACLHMGWAEEDISILLNLQ